MLTVREHQLITIAANPDPRVGRWETTMRDHTGYSPTLFWAHVRRLTRRPDALAERPTEVHRLLRLEHARRANRSCARGAPAAPTDGDTEDTHDTDSGRSAPYVAPDLGRAHR